MSAVLAAVRRAARETPQRIVVTSSKGALCWTDLEAQVDLLASRLTGDDSPVGVALDNGLDWVLADLALIASGRVSVPIPPFFTAEQRRHALADAGAGLLISAGEAGVRLDPTGLPRRPLHPGTAKITYTSGSTGQPKGVCLSLEQMEAVALALVEVLGRERAGVHMAVLPLGVLLENVAGLYPILLAGGRYHAPGLAEIGFANPFMPDVGQLLAEVIASEATSLILVPELLRGLIAAKMAAGAATPALDLVAVGGARVSPSLLSAAAAAGIPVVEGYGLSECASVVAMNRPGDAAPGTVGLPLPHLDVRVADDGEIIVGPSPFLGYVGGPRNEGPVRTGDLGSFDEAGRLRIEGRKSNLIITAFGRNISPEWVESELLAHPDILQAMVFGEAQAGLGALIVPLPGRTEAQIRDAVIRINARLPDYAHVIRWRLTAPFDPRAGQVTANGRPRRAALLSAHADFVADPDPIQSAGTVMSFFDQLAADTATERAAFAAVPQIRDGLQGRISRETYVAYLAQAYHHVRHTVPLMQATKARLGDSHHAYRQVLDDYIAEETGHEQWILNDIRAAGGDPVRTVQDGPNAATEMMVAYAYDYVTRVSPMGFFGMVFVLESVSIQLASIGADAVRGSLGLPPAAFTYLVSHGALDQDHIAFLRTVLDGVTSEDDRAAITHMARRMFGLFGNLFRSIPHYAEAPAARELSHAV